MVDERTEALIEMYRKYSGKQLSVEEFLEFREQAVKEEMQGVPAGRQTAVHAEAEPVCAVESPHPAVIPTKADIVPHSLQLIKTEDVPVNHGRATEDRYADPVSSPETGSTPKTDSSARNAALLAMFRAEAG